jgi:hypothetical protein
VTGEPAPAIFGYVYNSGVGETLFPCTDPPNSNQFVTFNNYTSSIGITFDGVSTLTLPVTGIYEATYIITGGPVILPNYMSLQLLSTSIGGNPTTIPDSMFYKYATSQYTKLVGNVKFSALAGNQINLANNTMVAINLPLPPGSPVAVANHSFNQVLTSTPIISMPISTSIGSSIYVAIQVGDGHTVTSISDNEGANYTFAGRIQDGVLDAEMWYRDNVTASDNLIVTAMLTNPADATIEVVELQGTATPSLGGVATTAGHSTSPSGNIITTSNANFGLMSIVGSNDGTLTFTADPDDFIIDAVPAPSPGQSVIGADVGRQLGAPGFYDVSCNVTGIFAVDWATVLVAVIPAATTPGTIFCNIPDNASIDIILLQQTA